MDVITFKPEFGKVREGRTEFHPKVNYGFEDPDAAAFFTAMGWAEPTTEAADVVISKEDLDIDPETVWGYGPNKGEPVMPERAAAARAAREAAGTQATGDIVHG